MREPDELEQDIARLPAWRDTVSARLRETAEAIGWY